MKSNLKKITDKTIQELLLNEIILPSSYFKSFDQNAKNSNINIHDADFENEVSDIIVDELNKINSYMHKTVENIELLSHTTDAAQKALKENDTETLKELNANLSNMKNEINALKDKMNLDPLTKTYSRRWVYNYGIKDDGTFKNDGLLLFINLFDCDYLAKKYGNLLADNVIQYIAKFLNKKFNAENLDCDIARYSNNQFILFINDESIENISAFVKNIRLILANTTLKSKSGLMFKTSFHFGIVQYNARVNFQDTLEQAASLAFKEKQVISEVR